MIIENWLKGGKRAAVAFTIDDLHPASKGLHGYDAGGDLSDGVFAHVDWLLQRHPQLKVTLFATADWREKSPIPTRKLLAKIPWLRDQFFLADIFPKDTMRLGRYPDFVSYYNTHPQVEIGLHGLHHCHKGLKIPVEFQNETKEECDVIVKEMLRIFDKSGIGYVNGFTPPAWNASEALQMALADNGVEYIASARDLNTPITPDARNAMSGLAGASIIYPERILGGRLIHYATNFQATTTFDRVKDIVDCNGLVSIKGHMIKSAYGFTMLDGIDRQYMEYLDKILSEIEDKWGDDIWWTSMTEMTNHIKSL